MISLDLVAQMKRWFTQQPGSQVAHTAKAHLNYVRPPPQSRHSSMPALEPLLSTAECPVVTTISWLTY